MAARLRVHHLSCGHFSPVFGRFIDGGKRPEGAPAMVCHCLLVETDEGLVLVDSGMGLEDVKAPAKRLGAAFVKAMGAQLHEEHTAARQVERLGFKRENVRHIVLTHLDLDHAGGLSDFPHAKVHVYAQELRAAHAPKTLGEKERYRPIQWAHGPDWAAYETQGEKWFGFDCVRQLQGLPPELVIVPLTGHSRGHAAVGVQTEGGWRLHAGDSYFFHAEVNAEEPSCPAPLRLFQWAVQIDAKARVENQARLRELVRGHGEEVRVFSAHDRSELERMQALPQPLSEDRSRRVL